MIAGKKICTTLALTFPFHCAIIRIAKIRQGLGVKTSGPFFMVGRGFILSPVRT